MNSPPTPSAPRLRFPVVLVLALAVVLAGELTLRFLLPGGGVHYALGLQEYRSLVREVADKGAAEVAVLGSSRAREGVLATDLQNAISHSAGRPYTVANYALAGAHATEVELVAERILNSPMHPKVVLYGVGPRQLLAKPRPHVNASLLWGVQTWFRARMRRGSGVDDFMGRAIRNSLSEWLWIVRYRRGIHEALLEPSKRGPVEALRRAVNQNRGQRYNPMRGQPAKWQQNSPHRSRKISRKSAVAYLLKVTGPNKQYEMDARQIERLTDTIAALRGGGVDVVLFAVPISAVLQKVLPPDLMPQFNQQMADIAQAYDARFLSSSDLGVKYQRKDFREQSHLNLRGAKKLTAALAGPALQSLGTAASKK